MKDDRIQAQMRKGALQFAVLLVISKKPVYTADIIESLMKYDLLVVEGTLYPLLERLAHLDCISYSWQKSSGGPQRKQYVITDDGNKMLARMKNEWESLGSSMSGLISDIS